VVGKVTDLHRRHVTDFSVILLIDGEVEGFAGTGYRASDIAGMSAGDKRCEGVRLEAGAGGGLEAWVEECRACGIADVEIVGVSIGGKSLGRLEN
jgi:hypothetical protein